MIKSKNWCVLATFAALSTEKTTPLDPIILLVPIIDALPVILTMINAQTNPRTMTPNRLAPTSPPPILPYVAQSTPSPVVSLVEALPLLPERGTFAISNQSTTSPFPITDATSLP